MSRFGLRSRVALAAGLIAVVAALSASSLVLWVAERALAQTAEQHALGLARAASQSLTVLLSLQRSRARVDSSAAARALLSDPTFLAQARDILGNLVASGARDVSLLDPAGALVASYGDAQTDPLGEPDRIAARLVAAGARPLVRQVQGEASRAFVVIAAGLGEALAAGLLVVTLAPSGRLAADGSLTSSRWSRSGSRLAGLRPLVLAVSLLAGVLVLFLGGLLLNRLIVEPLAQIDRATQRLAQGALDVVVSVDAPGEIGRLGASFNAMTERLRTVQAALVQQEKLATVGRLAAGVAHEVGNPLAAILGYVELLLSAPPGADRGLSPDEVRDTLERVQRETTRIHRIIQDLNAFAQPQGELTGPTDLGEAVAEAQELVRRRPRVGTLVVERRGLEALPRARASALRVTQIVTNLLANAADATQGAGTAIVEGASDERSVWITVRDSGPGIPDEVLPRIFDAFYTTKEPGEGMGLGLALSLAIARGLNGDLTARNVTDPKGAEFRLTLPLA